jgi:hypothetical protein
MIINVYLGHTNQALINLVKRVPTKLKIIKWWNNLLNCFGIALLKWWMSDEDLSKRPRFTHLLTKWIDM